MSLLLLADSFLTGTFDRIGYLGPFLLLLGAGAGLPVPEEVTMVGSGFLVYRGDVSLPAIIATCYTATLLGDSIPYWLGRHFGENALRFPIVARVVHPERMALLEKRFEQHGNWAVFTCRFLPGVRMPGWFMAGTLKMSYPRFLLCDGLGALIMTPTWVLLGKAFGAKIAVLEKTVTDLNQILGFALLAVLLVVVVRFAVHRRDRQIEKLSRQKPVDPRSSEGLPGATSSTPEAED